MARIADAGARPALEAVSLQPLNLLPDCFGEFATMNGGEQQAPTRRASQVGTSSATIAASRPAQTSRISSLVRVHSRGLPVASPAHALRNR
jgi:hypothetical protein